MRTVIFRPRVLIDIQEARQRYGAESDELAAEFLLAVQEALDRIQAHPMICPVVHRNARRLTMRRFPYNILYSGGMRSITVIAVPHTHHDPNVWKSRI
jgi:toxin ParE1/3/4